jgi:hypothetical protein
MYPLTFATSYRLVRSLLQYIRVQNISVLCFEESAANDGLAYPFLTISLYLSLEPNRWKDIQDWVVIGWLCAWHFCMLYPGSSLRQLLDQVVLGTIIGAVIGKRT